MYKFMSAILLVPTTIDKQISNNVGFIEKALFRARTATGVAVLV